MISSPNSTSSSTPYMPVSSGSIKDSRWLTMEVCREFQRSKCSRSDLECKFAHPPPHVEVQNGRVVCCYDSIKGKCQRRDPPCKYLHPPQHLREQLLQNGKNNLILKNIQMQILQQQLLAQAQGGMVSIPQTFDPTAHAKLVYSQSAGAAQGLPPTQPPVGAAAYSVLPYLSAATGAANAGHPSLFPGGAALPLVSPAHADTGGLLSVSPTVSLPSAAGAASCVTSNGVPCSSQASTVRPPPPPPGSMESNGGVMVNGTSHGHAVQQSKLVSQSVGEVGNPRKRLRMQSGDPEQAAQMAQQQPMPAYFPMATPMNMAAYSAAMGVSRPVFADSRSAMPVSLTAPSAMMPCGAPLSSDRLQSPAALFGLYNGQLNALNWGAYANALAVKRPALADTKSGLPVFQPQSFGFGASLPGHPMGLTHFQMPSAAQHPAAAFLGATPVGPHPFQLQQLQQFNFQ